jgi:hypothetical protein
MLSPVVSLFDEPPEPMSASPDAKTGEQVRA